MENIKDHFDYNPDTGIITRKTRANSNGSYDKNGYLIIKFNKRQIKAHRLAWFLYYGKFPVGVIDHKNGIKTDNRIENLRDVTVAINNQNVNRPPNPETGVVGIYVDKSTKGLKRKFTFRHNKKMFRFRNLSDAIAAKQQLT